MVAVKRVLWSLVLASAVLGSAGSAPVAQAVGPPSIVSVDLPGRVVACGAPYLDMVQLEAKLLLTPHAPGTGRLHVTLTATGGWLLHPTGTQYSAASDAGDKVDVSGETTEVVVSLTMPFRAESGSLTLRAQLVLRVVIAGDGGFERGYRHRHVHPRSRLTAARPIPSPEPDRPPLSPAFNDRGEFLGRWSTKRAAPLPVNGALPAEPRGRALIANQTRPGGRLGHRSEWQDEGVLICRSGTRDRRRR